MDVDSAQDRIGSVIGRSRLAVVVRADAHRELFEAFGPKDRPVWLEVLRDRDAEEALPALEAAKRLVGKHLLPPLECGVDRQTESAWAAFARAPGKPFAAHLLEAPLEPEAVVRIGVQLAVGLEEMHREGVVHGRVEPANVFVEEGTGGQVTARLAGLGGTWAGTAYAATTEDAVLAYRAPELGDGANPDASTDLWGLGAILYHALTGVPPSLAPPSKDGQGDESPVVASLLERAPWVVEPLARAVHGALLFDPSARCLSASELLDALKILLEDDEPLRAAVLSTVHHKAPAEPPELPLPQHWDEVMLHAMGPKPPDASSLVGEIIGGKYELLRVLGEGGMGVVYEARRDDDVMIALKVIRPSIDDEKGLVSRRFHREARASMSIESPYVVNVLDTGIDPNKGTAFIAMELLQGENLSETIERIGPIEQDVAARIFLEASRGVAAAHEMGLIHRDVKPSNMFLHEQADGTVVTKICDFGIAKDHKLSALAKTTSITASGDMLGSPAYMSPEQAQNPKQADQRADVWSLSISLYEAVCGRSPWPGYNTLGELLKYLYTTSPTPVQDRAPWVSAELATIIHRGLERDAEKRFASAGELADALEPFAADVLSTSMLVPVSDAVRASEAPRASIGYDDTIESQARAPRQKPRPWLLMAGLAVVAGVVGVYAVGSQEAVTPEHGAPTESGCVSSKACIDELGEAAVCRPGGRCVALASEDCEVLADEGTVGDDQAIWFGAMFPTQGDQAEEPLWKASRQAVELGRRELNKTGGLPRPGARGGARPLGLLMCDDVNDYARAAAHLVDVGVPAVIGFRRSEEVIELARDSFIPNGILAVPSLNASHEIMGIPHPPDSPRLVWRTEIIGAAKVPAMTAFLHDVVEPAHEGREVRVAMVSPPQATGLSLADQVLGGLEFNGRSAIENGERFLQVRFSLDEAPKAIASEVDALLEHAPNVVLLNDRRYFERLVLPLEARWSGDADSRPTYLFTVTPEGPHLGKHFRADPSLEKRVIGLSTPAQTKANINFTSNYNAAFDEKETPETAPAGPYDAYYLLAYAAYAVGDAPVTGKGMAEAIARLQPAGEKIDVGPTNIQRAFSLLDQGKNVDLQGAYSTLDFDLESGETTSDFVFVCPELLADGRVMPRPSGLRYDAQADEVTGELGCD